MNTTQLNDAHYGTIDGWLDANGYESIEAWGRDSDYLLTESDGWVDLDDNPVDLYERAWSAYEAETAADDAERDPLQFHFVVFAEKTDEGIRWSIDVDSALLDGNVYDPNLGWSDGWRTMNDDEEDMDNEFMTDLERRLNATVVG